MVRLLLHWVLVVFVTFFAVNGNCQSPVIVVQSFEYIWQKDFVAKSTSSAPRVIIPMADSAKLLIKNSFARAILNRWNIVLPDVSWSVKPLPFLSHRPEFNTRLKNKHPGNWYLFLQVFDKGNFTNLFGEEIDTFSTTLELRCKVINGANDSVVLDRALTVNIYKELTSSDQVILKRLPAYPAYFIRGFDSIASWLFQSEEPLTKKSLRLRPACIFPEVPIKPGSSNTRLIFHLRKATAFIIV